MPVNKDALSRYRWIDERLRSRHLPKPTLEDLIEYVSEKMNREIAVRTLQLDLSNMRNNEELNYHAPIEYNRQGKYYYYSEADYSISKMPVSEYDLQGLEIAIGILEQFQKLPVIRQFEDAILRIAAALKINREQLKNKSLIRLEAPPQYKGLEWIPDIATALKDREILRIAYQSFERNEPKEHWMEPYHLREYNNRFYLIGKSLDNKGKSKDGKLRTLGLDRIVDMWPTGNHFEEKNFDDAYYFKNSLGITVFDQKPEKIVLSFTPQQAKYIKSQPIHESQKILKDTGKECQIELKLILNHELFMILLSYGANVKVLRPEKLVQHMREEVKAMNQLYQ